MGGFAFTPLAGGLGVGCGRMSVGEWQGKVDEPPSST